MAIETNPEPAAPGTLPSRQVGALAAFALIVGLAIGTLIPTAQTSESRSPASPTASPAAAMGNAHRPSMDDMKQMADKQAAPLVEKLKSDPNNVTLLVQVGGIYHITHQFAQASGWYAKAVQIDPKNVPIRTKLAISLFRAGDTDGAIDQLNQGLAIDPRNANSLFNLGMIRLQGKGDAKGALAAWQLLLKSNPQLSADRKAVVVKLMGDVMTTMNGQPGMEGVSSNDKHKSRID
ncbi:MAG TPA: tetratricopeptide repeat protein [Acidobacteriaceae bacterium]|jgi:cytochrome c-type biogenesis protein CcmH/NrfG|nr:tetratricopeptide repeat protein [Acidobacteriaceae bacterium]